MSKFKLNAEYQPNVSLSCTFYDAKVAHKITNDARQILNQLTNLTMQTFVIETKYFSSDANCDIRETYVITITDPNLDTCWKIEADIRRQLLDADFVTFEDQTIRSYDIAYGEFKVFELDDWVCKKVNSLKPIETRIKQSLASPMTEIPHGLTTEEIITFIETNGT